MPLRANSGPLRRQSDLLGSDPILASPDAFLRIISGSARPELRKSTERQTYHVNPQRIQSLRTAHQPSQPQPGRLDRAKTYEVSKSLPPLPRGDQAESGPTAEHSRSRNKVNEELEPLLTFIRSNLNDAKRGALAQLSLPLPTDVDQSVANYCKGLHSEYSPLPPMDPGDSFFLGKQVETQSPLILEAVTTHFLTLTLRGIFDFVKDDIVENVQENVLQFAVERIGVLLGEEGSQTQMQVAFVRTDSQVEPPHERIYKRKSYAEWEKDQKRKTRGVKVGAVEYLDDTLDEVIGDIITCFRMAMMASYKGDEDNIEGVNRVEERGAKSGENLSNDSPLVEFQNETLNAVRPSLREVKVGGVSTVPLKDLVLYSRAQNNDGPVVRASPEKKPRIGHSGMHEAESATFHGLSTDESNRSPISRYNLQPRGMQAAEQSEQKPDVQGAHHIHFQIPEEYHAYSLNEWHHAPSPALEAASKKRQPTDLQDDVPTPELPKRSMLVSRQDHDRPRKRAYSELKLKHPMPISTAARKHVGRSGRSPLGSTDAMSLADFATGCGMGSPEIEVGTPRPKRSPVPNILRAGPAAPNVDVTDPVSSPRLNAMLHRLSRLETSENFTDEHDTSEDYIPSGGSSGTVVIVIPDTAGDSEHEVGAAEEEEDFWLMAEVIDEGSNAGAGNGGAVYPTGSIGDLHTRVQRFVRGGEFENVQMDR